MKFNCKTILLSSLFNSVLFWAVLFFFKLIYNSGDDAICAYILGGGFGSPPSELVYYNHVLHPFATLTIKFFFTAYPHINWYTWVLLAMHFFATTLILINIVQKKRIVEGLLIYTLFFLVFEIYFLLSLSFTNTSIILTSASLGLLFNELRKEKISIRNYLFACMILILAAAFRMHTLIPFVAIALPFLVAPCKKGNAKYLCFFAFFVAMFIFFLNQTHKFHYNNHIPNWETDEAYRQKLYKFYNNDRLNEVSTFNWSIEKELVMNSLILDTNYLNSNKLSLMYRDLKQKKTISLSFYWFFINNKLYFLTLFFSFFCYASTRCQKKISLFSFLVFATEVIFLMLFFKLPGYIVIGATGLISLLTVLNSDYSYFSSSKGINILTGLFFCFLLFLGVIRLFKISIDNSHKHNFFVNVEGETKKYRDTLFLVTDNSFPIDYCSIFTAPAKYPLANISLGWQYDRGLNLRALKMLKVNSIKDIPTAPNILFWGKPVQALLDYFEITTGEKYRFSEPLREFKYGEVRKLVREEN